MHYRSREKLCCILCFDNAQVRTCSERSYKNVRTRPSPKNFDSNLSCQVFEVLRVGDPAEFTVRFPERIEAGDYVSGDLVKKKRQTDIKPLSDAYKP